LDFGARRSRPGGDLEIAASLQDPGYVLAHIPGRRLKPSNPPCLPAAWVQGCTQAGRAGSASRPATAKNILCI